MIIGNICLFLSAIITIYLVKRNGLTSSSFLLISILVYYHPILLSDNIVWFFNGVSNSEVCTYSRLCIISVITILIIYNFGSREKNQFLDKQFSGKKYSFFALIAFLLGCLILSYCIFSLGLGLAGRSKAQLFEHVTYQFKLMQSFGVVSFSAAIVSKSKKLMLCNLIFPLVLLLYGMRELTVNYLILYSLLNQNKKMIIYLSFLGLFLVIFKVFGYGQFPLEVVTNLYADKFESFEGLTQIIMLSNPESAGTSAVFNEVVKTGFCMPIKYLFGVILSILPFIGQTGYHPAGLEQYLRDTVLSYEYFSFAPSFFVIGFSIFGIIGVILSILVLHKIITWIEYHGYRTNSFLIKVTCFSILSVLAFMINRHELIYLISVIRGILGATLITYISYLIFYEPSIWLKALKKPLLLKNQCQVK